MASPDSPDFTGSSQLSNRRAYRKEKSKNRELQEFANFLIASAYVILFLGFIFGLFVQPITIYGFVGISLIIIGGFLLSGYFYVKVHLIESRYQ